MTNQNPLENTLLANRSKLTARQSMQSLIKYAQISDSRVRNRFIRLSRTNTALTFLLYVPITLYTVHYFAVGEWQNIHPNGFIDFLTHSGRPMGVLYTPEMYMKEEAERNLRAHIKRTNNSLILWS